MTGAKGQTPMPAPLFRLPPPVAYIVSVVFEKGFSILTIPLVAAYLRPSDYGRLDVAVSLIEFAGLILSFGMGETLMRFAGTAADEAEQKRVSAELMAGALVLAVTLGTALQIAAPWLAQTLNVAVGTTALRWGLAGATFTALLEMPLVWLRMRGRADHYLLYVAARSVVQVVLMWLVLRAGWGSDGILIANGAAVLAFTLLMAGQQVAATGLAFTTGALRRIGGYGLPLVGGALAMFALGSCNRWFLSGRVPDAEIAFFGLAAKLALAAPLLLQPFALWWNPRRIAALSRPGGLEESAWAFGLGYSVLIISALGVSLAGPAFIELALPKAYSGASTYLPFVVLICFLNELNTLCNAGAYARDTGYAVLSANIAGAMTAVAGYAAFAPWLGVPGVIVAMIAGHLVRLAVFLWAGRALAPIAYPAMSAALVLLLAAATIWLAPQPSAILARIGWTAVSVAIVTAALLASRLLRIPEALMPMPLRRFVHAGIR